jgi:crotonobetainyl-CoA:carnitine CoA-transferase CaiB-like acyl-CoA transferase
MEQPGHQGPLVGVRVLELSFNRPGRIAGRLLADLGADVIRAVLSDAGDLMGDDGSPGDSTPGDDTPPGGSGRDVAADLVWDCGKRRQSMTVRQAIAAADSADILLVDASPQRRRQLGLDAAVLRASRPGLIHVALPPYGEIGEWAEVAEDPLLLASVGGIAGRYPSWQDRPVAPISATTTQTHGALGAAAAIAGLFSRQRRGGVGGAVVVTGLNACAAVMAMMTPTGLDQQVFTSSRSPRATPNWRLYQCADGRWLYLATLVPSLFFRALEAMERMDVMVLPGVDGEFQNLTIDGPGSRAAAAVLEEVFAQRTVPEWVELFAAADVPCQAVGTRAEWAIGDVVTANHGLVERVHVDHGVVTLPGVPIVFDETPGAVGEYPSADPSRPSAGAGSWAGRPESGPVGPTQGAAGEVGQVGEELPLRGLRVVDASSFLAGPMIGEMLAEWGADVIKVEPPSGDQFRTYPMSVLVTSQHKRAIALDLEQPAAQAVVRRLAAASDVLIENFRPGRQDRLGIGYDVLRRSHPDLVQCSVSAYGRLGEFADRPGFDPVFQAMSGLASAQGGDAGPVLTGIPLNDTCTAVLGLVGCLAALFARSRGRGGQRVHVSLASTSLFLQSREFTTFAGCEEAARGDTDYLGRSPDYRHYQCADGWLAVAATTSRRRVRLAEALDVAADADAISGALVQVSVAQAAARLAEYQVPAVRVVEPAKLQGDQFLLDNRFSHTVDDPRFGRVSIVRSFAEWGTDAGRPPARAVLIGQDTRAVLHELDYSDAAIGELIAAGAAADLESRPS